MLWFEVGNIQIQVEWKIFCEGSISMFYENVLLADLSSLNQRKLSTFYAQRGSVSRIGAFENIINVMKFSYP